MCILYKFWHCPIFQRFIYYYSIIQNKKKQSYDESLNTILEVEQMDMLIRFFSETIELVETRYFDSTVLKCRNGTNLLHKLLIESLIFVSINYSCQWMVLMSI